MNKLITVSAVALGAVAILSATPKVFAYQGDPNVKGPNYSEERHAAMTHAFENNDYAAWKTQMQGKGRVSQIINEENFARFTEMHKLMLEGNTAEAEKIRAELGLGTRNGSGKGNGGGYGRNSNR